MEKEKDKFVWWVDSMPFGDKFDTLEEAVEDAKQHSDDFEGSIITIGILEGGFDYEDASKECVSLVMDRFDEIYVDWQGSLDDDKVWWNSKFKEELTPILTDMLKKYTDFSVKEKAMHYCNYDLLRDKMI